MSPNPRNICYTCYRPNTSCMCSYITPIETNTRFIILMHPKEFRKTKNGTGHFTNLSLTNCEIYVGINFTKHHSINAIINNPSNICYTLYPHEKSISLSHERIGEEKKNSVIFLIDSTWPCSRAILRASPNIDALQKVSFTHSKVSQFSFKEQPKTYCLSTMESTLCLLEIFNTQKLEQIPTQALENFLLPFKKMVAYQLSCET